MLCALYILAKLPKRILMTFLTDSQGGETTLVELGFLTPRAILASCDEENEASSASSASANGAAAGAAAADWRRQNQSQSQHHFSMVDLIRVLELALRIFRYRGHSHYINEEFLATRFLFVWPIVVLLLQ